ncbi:hypothetical protein KXD93_22425 [Mucilaginibacter sp. BJC16-A38]|uniref:DUF6520 family protein n=1 Tax=Mucilaginibacter phenanthrenivorans TaxID=1234842 RepID=UPI00215893E0|nr:DUF6520 family protein [Mucilaginibacter phenanthrenivorans]MCR8560427.1 hypothetical protein [Mucilaginibacter phenanthrenivorans]
MKNLKISLSVFALALGLGFAFMGSNPAKAANNRPTISWFTYNGGNVDAPSSYTQVSSPSCPTGTANLCAIQATVGTGSKPVITDDLASEINDDLASHTPSANVDLRN